MNQAITRQWKMEVKELMVPKMSEAIQGEADNPINYDLQGTADKIVDDFDDLVSCWSFGV